MNPATLYARCRAHIRDGDVLGMSCRGGLWRLVRLGQRIAGLGGHARYTHTGVAWWVNGRLYSVEMDGARNVLRPLSQHIAEGKAVAVFRAPVAASAMAAQFDRATAAPIVYDWPDLLRIALRLLLRSGGGSADNSSAMVCSTFAARWLQWAGWQPPENFPGLPSPGELCRALGAPMWVVEGKTNAGKPETPECSGER